jgi:hypothetical protein
MRANVRVGGKRPMMTAAENTKIDFGHTGIVSVHHAQAGFRRTADAAKANRTLPNDDIGDVQQTHYLLEWQAEI